MSQPPGISLSILDRLIDNDPGVSTEVPATPEQTQRDLHQAVRRDLEALLNTRQRVANFPVDLDQLDRSLVNYGIPDFTGANLASEESRAQFVRVIEAAISRYEPRFKRTRVSLLDNAEPLDRTLRFRIDAVVHAEPTPETVVFDSAMEPVTGNVEVKDTGHG